MTEQDTPTPDAESFDISAWLSKGDAGRARETVTVYNDLSLLDEARELAAEIRKHNESAELEPEDLAVGEASKSHELQARQDELEERLAASKAEVVITSLSPREAEQLVDDYKEKFGEKAKIDSELTGTFWRLSRSATFSGQRLTPEQWEALSETIAGGQWFEITQKMGVAQGRTPRVDNPFSRGGSRLSKAVTAS